MKAKAKTLEAAIGAGDATKAAAARMEWETAAAEYASTDEGHAYLSDAAARADAGGDADTAAMLSTLVRKGEAIRAANRETSSLLAAVRMTSSPVEGFTAPDRPAGVVAVPEGDEMISWITAKDRVAWDEYESQMAELEPFVERLTGTSRLKEVLDAFTESVEKVSDPEATEDQLVAAAKATGPGCYPNEFYSPSWKRFDDLSVAAKARAFGPVEAENGAPNPLWDPAVRHPDVLEDRRRALSKTGYGIYKKAALAGKDARRRFTQSLMDHPNATPRVFERIAATDSNLAAVTDHPRCPESVLAKAIRTGTGTNKMSDGTWERARSARWESPAMALSLSAGDPDSFHRNEAFNQVMVTPIESFSEDDRLWLARNLDQMPGSEEGHATLAGSLTSWSQGYGDKEERRLLSEAFLASESSRIREFGIRLAGARAEESAGGKRGWFRG